MKIGFDGKRIIQNFTGLGNYSRYIVNLLASNFPENSYHIYSSKRFDDFTKLNLISHLAVSFKHPKRGKSFLWRSWRIVKDLKKDQIAVYHGLSNEIPLSLKKCGIPSVVTVHDLIFLHFPQYYKFIDRKIYEFKVRYACTNASRIIAISDQTKRDLISFFKIPEDRIDVVYQNCDPVYHTLSSTQEKERVKSLYKLPSEYLLNVGTIEKRKNLLLIVKALKSVPENVHLVVVGKQTDYAREVKQYIKANKLQSRVHFLSKVPLTDLPAIYQQSKIFIYPSEYEGFGIPVIEALHSQVPVIAATGSCLEEAGGPESCYVHPKDEVQMAYCINSILSNQEKQNEMISAGIEYVKKFADARIATELMNVYIKTVNNA